MAEISFGGHTPRCAGELCLNQRHKNAGCTRCVDHCPTSAIGLTANRPALDPGLCVQCGACVAACPTDVFTQPSPPEQTLALTFQNLPPPAAPLALICPLHPVRLSAHIEATPTQTHTPVAAVVRHQRCLAAISIPHLLDVSSQGTRPLWLDDSPCGDCPLVACHGLLRESVAGANALLVGAGRPAALALPTTHASQLLTEPLVRPVLDGMKPQTSRRGFFDALRQIGQQRVERALEEEAPPMLRPAVAVDQRLPRHLPHSRKELLRRLAALVAESAPPAESQISLANTPFAAVSVDTVACSACGLCARFCPTGALHFDGPGMGALRKSDATYALSFQPRLCIDCAICQVACPDDAIAFGESLPLGDLLMSQGHELAAGGLVACASCGVAVADHWRPPRCYVCRQGAGSGSSPHDRTGLMADLLQRTTTKPG